MKVTVLLGLIFLFTSSFIKNKNIIEIDINHTNEITLNQDVVQEENLCDSLMIHLFNNNFSGKKYSRHQTDLRKVVVSIYAARNVEYKKYIAVYNEIIKAYSHAWNTLSLSKYSIEYKQLNKPQQSKIRNILPKKISEADSML